MTTPSLICNLGEESRLRKTFKLTIMCSTQVTTFALSVISQISTQKIHIWSVQMHVMLCGL